MTLGTLQPTTFDTFYGVGYNDGPISLTSAGGATTLQLKDAFDYNSSNPALMFYDGNLANSTIPDNTAALVAAPEPSSLALVTGMLGVFGLYLARLTAPNRGPRRWQGSRGARR